jgi:hypothetical protein
MARKPPKPKTWLQVAVANAGFRKGYRAIMWSLSWVMAREALGYDPSVDEVAEWWAEPRRTAFAEQQAFRAAFPTLLTPAPMFESLAAQRKIKDLVRRVKNIENLRKASSIELEKLALEIAMMQATG